MPTGGGLRESGGEIRGFLARIQAGDEQAARELLDRYEGEVRRVVRRRISRRLRARFDALDFLQSVWGEFFHRMRTSSLGFKDSRHLVAFLVQVAKNKVIDEYRRVARERLDVRRGVAIWPHDRRLCDRTSAVDSPGAIAQAREEFGRLRALLSADRRVILELKAEGLSSPEIGARLGLSERTVQRTLADLRRRAGIGR